jgi:hypothetical protein
MSEQPEQGADVDVNVDGGADEQPGGVDTGAAEGAAEDATDGDK